MVSMGIRVTPKNVFYCITEENDENIEILTISKITIPKALEVPNKLSFLRNTIATIIRQYNVTNGGIRIIEPSSQGKVDIFRANAEGVIQEVFADSTISRYFLGISVRVASLLDVTKQSIESIFDNSEIFEEMRNEKKYSKDEKEAVVVAIAASNL